MKTLNSFFLPVFFLFILQSCVTICEKMSELTERSKCVFQAKLAEQAERYDGASIHSSLLLFFISSVFLYARTTLRENISVKMDPISLPFLFQFVRVSLSLFSLSLSLASRSLRADDACTSLSLSLTFFFLVNLPFLAQR